MVLLHGPCRELGGGENKGSSVVFRGLENIRVKVTTKLPRNCWGRLCFIEGVTPEKEAWG